MKKAVQALPAISILAYLVAVVVCIASIVRGAEADMMTIIIFLIYVAGVMTLMAFSTRFLIKKKRGDYNKEEENDPLEDLAAACADEETNDSEETEKADDAAEGSENVDEAKEAEPDSPEVDVVKTEGADENDDDDKNNVIVPVVISADDNDDEDEDEDDDDDDDDDDIVGVAIVGGDGNDDPNIPGYARSRYTRTYAAKLIQADDELKGYYSIVKNAFMSYKKVTCSVSREHERFRKGRTTIGIIKLRGKSLLVYLALDPKQFEDTMYVGEDVSNVVKYASTPFLYRVKGPRKANRAARLIAMLAEKLEMSPTAEPANEDYVARFPYEDNEALIEKGLIIDNIAEAERKAEEARIAAEEAEAAAHKAIEDAIKAKEHATKVSERSERTVDEIEAAEEAKAAKESASNN